MESIKRKFLDFKVIVEQVTCYQFLRLIGWEYYKRKGDSMRGKCPLHGSESHTSKVFQLSRGRWHCWKCQKRGDVIQLYCELYGVDHHTAATELVRLFDVRFDPAPSRK